VVVEGLAVERLQRSGHLIAGTVDDVRGRLDEIVQRVNPEYLVYGPDQGISSFDECKRQLRLFGEEIVPRYLT
jgi:hypothetical protein